MPPSLKPIPASIVHRGATRPFSPRGFLVAAALPWIALFPQPALGNRVNFAKYQTTASNSASDSYGSDFAVDGIVSNFHSFRTGNTNQPHWFEVRFPRPVTMASAHLYLGLDNDPAKGLTNFTLQQHDGSGWLDIPGTTVAGNTATELPLVFAAAITSDRFRLWTDDNGVRVIRELAFFPPNLLEGVEQGFPLGSDVRLNLAYKRPATASSSNPTNAAGPGYPKLAFDGYVANQSRWLCDDQNPGEFLEIDLLDTHQIGSAHLYSGFVDEFGARTLPLPNFKLQSWTGAAWADIPGTEITNNSSVERVIPFAQDVSTSRVRIVTTSAFNGRVQELLIFPPNDGGYPLGREVVIGAPFAAKWDDYSDHSYRLRCGISDGRMLGFYDDGVRFSPGTLTRNALGWQLLLNYRDGSYRIRHNASGKCLALGHISDADQTPVVLEEYTALPHQDWFFQPVDASHFRIVNAYSGMALQTRFSNWTPGNPMVVRPVDGTNLQRWRTQDPIHLPKKGLAATHNPANPFPGSTQTWLENSWENFNGPSSSWSYSWGRQSSGTFPFMTSNHTFNPMQWGNFNWVHGTNAGPLDSLRRDLHSNPKPVHLMGFNEPEKSGQGVISVADAIRRWPRLEAMEVPLVSPVPANAFNGWLAEFSTLANDLGYRRDYTAVHWYGAPNAQSLINHLQQNFNTFGRPVWLTEFSTVDWNQTSSWTRADNYAFLAEFMWRAESLPWIKRYSLFQFRAGTTDNPNQSAPDRTEAPRSNARNEDGTLTAFGELYAGWDGVTEVLNDKAYHLHNRGTYRRMQNPASTDTVAASDPEVPTTGSQWFLIPGTTADTVRIVSALDGRRLRFFTGTSVGLAAATNLQLQTEWRIVAHQDGWHFIVHPNTNQRLRINGSGTFVMGPISGTSDDYQWRFAAPAAAERVSPPAPPSRPTTQPSTTEIALSWPPVPGADSYTVHRLATSGGPSQQLIAGLAATSWTDTGLPYETGYFYTVTANNVLGSSAPSAEVSATTLHPFATYQDWLGEKLGELPAKDQLPGTDPDGDQLENLLEFAFLTDPALPNGNPLKAISPETESLTIEFPWNWRAAGLTWQLRHGEDLADVGNWPVTDPGPVTAWRDGDVDLIRIRPAKAHPVSGFYVLEVIGN